MPSKPSFRRYRVILDAPRSASSFITYGYSIVTSMSGNSWFPRPSPSLAKVKTALVVLEKAQAATLKRSMGLAAARDVALLAAKRLLQQLASYVQTIADANRDESLAIIQSSGFSAKKGSGSRAHVFEVERDEVSGSARLTAPVVADRARYFWQKRTDGSQTWIDLPSTTQSTTVVNGLKRGTTVLFRYKTLTKDGESNWSKHVEYLVD